MPMWSNSTPPILFGGDLFDPWLIEELDLQALDARPVDVDDLEAQPIVEHLVARLGRPAERAEDESRNGVVVLLRQFLAELLVEIVDREGAVDSDAAVVEALDRLVGQVVFVFDLAHDLLEEVLERDEALERAVFVDDDRHVLVRAPELREHGGEVLSLGDDVRLAHEPAYVNVVDTLVVEGLEEVAYV